MTAAGLTIHARTTATRLVATGWHWWLAEIKAMIPARMASALDRHRTVALLVVGDGPAELRAAGWDKAIPLPASGAQAGEPPLSLRDDLGTTRLRLCLRGEAVLHTVLTLPAAVEENLREVLSFELDRRTPFAAADARFAYRVVERDRAKEQIRVALAVAPREIVAEGMALARQLGATVDALDLSPQPGSGELLTGSHDGDDPATGAKGRRAWRLALLAGAALAIAAAAVPLVQTRHEVARLRDEVAAARTDAALAAKLEDEVARLSSDAAFLTARKRQTVSAIALLGEVTHQLPDNTWLEDFSFDATELSMKGYSGSSSGLIKQLTSSRLMSGPHFESPVTVEPGSGRERFEIRARRIAQQEASR